MRLSALLLVVIVLVLGGPPTANAEINPTVRVETGELRGIVRDGVEQFLGVPYAAAPVGPLRWHAPLPPMSWTGERGAGVSGARCPQTRTGDAPRSEVEDCLTLNVYRPAKNSPAARAVLVYLHGGGATNGAGADHDGSALAGRGDIIVVTVNYRLGALGFLNHPALADDRGLAGNYGVQDVEAAVRWTARNIAAFGGDPAKVTLGGESAGGTVLCPLLTSASARGLFRAAIISSDDCLHDVDLSEASRARGEDLAKRAGCTDAECLRTLTAGQLVDIGGFSAPHVGGADGVGATTFDRIARGDWNAVPVLLGANREEGRVAGPAYLSFDRVAYRGWLRGLVSDDQARLIERAYPVKAPGLKAAYAVSQVITDSGMRGLGGCTSLALAKAMSVAAPVFYYQFEDPDPPFDRRDDGYRFGAAHSAELAYLWPGGAFADRAARLRPEQRALSDRMIAYWSRFVRTGDPGGGWPQISGGRGRFFALRRGKDQARPLRSFEVAHHCDLWSAFPWIMLRG